MNYYLIKVQPKEINKSDVVLCTCHVITPGNVEISAPEVKQVWLADDATAAGSLASLLTWWGTYRTR